MKQCKTFGNFLMANQSSYTLLQCLVVQALNCMLETQVTFSMLLCLLKLKNP